MLSASLIGALFAQHFPGAIYVSQSLRFRAPLYYDELATARIEVLAIERRKLVRCRTVVEKRGKDAVSRNTAEAQQADADASPVVVVEGEATVLVDSSAVAAQPSSS